MLFIINIIYYIYIYNLYPDVCILYQTPEKQTTSRLYPDSIHLYFLLLIFFPRKYDRHNGPPRSGFLPLLPFTLTLLPKLLQAFKSFGSLRPKFGMLCPTEL